ncbi:MAG: PTS sugar transporter subunit IIA [Planctomycetes bacterium]|nr:PTS sugar transporter subunit IIA [Planctomycetota bacterium]
MFHVSEFLRPDRVKLTLEAVRKKEAIKEVASILDGDEAVLDREQFLKEIFQREKVETTGIGNGVAIPHARTDAVGDLVISVGRSADGVDFGAVDGKPVKLIFVMGTPKANVTKYLKLLAQLSRLVRSNGCVEKVLNAGTRQDVVDVFREAEGL